jgi:phosphopantetheinyl transferase (holo-ACP synthase)
MVQSILVTISVASIKKSRARVEKKYFPGAVVPPIPLQSLAGIVAVKTAIVGLVKTIYGIGIAPKDIIVKHKQTGSPYLVLDSAALRKTMPEWRSIRISISHTATHAFGLAVEPEKGC